MMNPFIYGEFGWYYCAECEITDERINYILNNLDLFSRFSSMLSFPGKYKGWLIHGFSFPLSYIMDWKSLVYNKVSKVLPKVKTKGFV